MLLDLEANAGINVLGTFKDYCDPLKKEVTGFA